mmetsp:Transcript_50948/g.100145  ORF Transcript_50948/g.100145 Transcript_50948/m.100145 type:complete len:220 (-) Transcript_50948:224-883(-)
MVAQQVVVYSLPHVHVVGRLRRQPPSLDVGSQVGLPVHQMGVLEHPCVHVVLQLCFGVVHSFRQELEVRGEGLCVVHFTLARAEVERLLGSHPNWRLVDVPHGDRAVLVPSPHRPQSGSEKETTEGMAKMEILGLSRNVQVKEEKPSLSRYCESPGTLLKGSWCGHHKHHCGVDHFGGSHSGQDRVCIQGSNLPTLAPSGRTPDMPCLWTLQQLPPPSP